MIESNIIYNDKKDCQIINFENINFKLVSGLSIQHLKIAFKTFGELNADKTNAILICHALTGDQYVTGKNPITNKDGWWSRMVGPNKPIDTNIFFVISSNVLGGCAGSTGPKERNPKTNKPYGGNFPSITIKDMVKAQTYLIDSLKIKKLFSVIGGSMGAMQALQWSIDYPERIETIIHIAGALKHSTQNIAFNEVGRQAIMNDPLWLNGNYHLENKVPERGLSVARMIGHITYLSEDAMHRKFGRKLQSRDIISFGFDADFQIESYLRYQGRSFVERFDANSYLYLTRAMDYFDHSDSYQKSIEFSYKPNNHIRYLIISFTSDWLFPTNENKTIVETLNYLSKQVSFIEIETDKGHDSFLLDEPELDFVTKGFLENNKVLDK
ncbi:MAG: Homoserine O-acetyltransferase [Alphaproteobacteria bacterium MarineAlpha5_Bin5]|nr:MAG: Homoserine O-acetyltransferase [Alphaproteobacteria bacterium MarineAlpha5_Bin5]PPR52816.1 MAG: Homoserine O-acetyltransferase [Alphaproteobacteria bacterium MarineAlpha5_Bin4]|tara:strand:+ start:8529 stop:9677 length:1149 start_codon:yes stop_codon:yes gene_type:complete